ncbi:hypothetical protein ANTQUA_LOCUS9073 [Anthophora quadrimaculata]
MSTVCQQLKKATEVSDVLPEKEKPIDCPNLRVCTEDKDKKQHHLKEGITRSRVKHEGRALIIARRARLRHLFEREAIELENLLRALGYAFIPTQP